MQRTRRRTARPRGCTEQCSTWQFASGLALHFGGDAVEYATYMLNRSSCCGNLKSMAPLEILTCTSPILADMVTFSSSCIIGKNNETKGFRVYLPKERVVITTQQLQNVETLNNEQNTQLQAQLELEDPNLRRAVAERDEAVKRKEPSKRDTCSGTRACDIGQAGGVQVDEEGCDDGQEET
ncbi:Copia LTR rider [Phytophthora megakarya]|uniref:Copia LTR rider n=1 Tax=Phytophthora megakarya TaxID=4795 RepID=A0A225VFR3_9STRA|nr:Copia LTR rider [Phytophthora megakarya]